MSPADPPDPRDRPESADSDATLLARAAELLAGVGGKAPPLPDRPAVAGSLFRNLIEGLDEATADEVSSRAARLGARGVPTAALGIGDRIGPVRLEEVLGEGGMGRVLRGYDEKLGRAVAVKTVRASAGLTPAARARFRREARLLSRLNHPAICQVYDLVERPEADYLLLELVEGETLRRWFERAPSQAERMALATRIAEAIAVAHRAGVVHRDLKPENVMVTPVGGVKVLDFGIARAEAAAVAEQAREAATTTPLGQPALGEETPGSESAGGSASQFRSELGSVIGTPAYMSPEQARGEPVQAATDVWALGVLLHELFAGKRPFAGTPGLPSPAEISEIQVDPALDRELARLLGQMLAPQPAARPTAEEARARLVRIAGRPARIRRRALAALAAAATLFGAVRYVVDVRAERAEAVTARAEAEEVVRFLVSLFEVALPEQSRGETITARELLSRGSERLTELAGQPRVHARLEATVGSVYSALGLYDEAAPHLERALARRQELLGSGHPDSVETAVRWAELEQLRGRVAEADAVASVALEEARRLAPGATRDELLSEALEVRGTARRWLGRLAEAESDKREALAIAETRFGNESREAAIIATGLALVLDDQGRDEEAEPLARRAVQNLDRLLAPDHPDLNVARNNLGLVLTNLGRYEEAVPILREELAFDEKVLGSDHPSVGISLDNLAIALAKLGRLAEAEPLVRRAVEIFSAAGGEHHYGLATALHNLGSMAREQGRLDEAAVHFERAIAIYRQSLGADNPTLAGSLRGYSVVRQRQGRLDEAARLLTEALAIDERAQGLESPALLVTLRRLAAIESARGRHGEAEAQARRALAIAEAAWGSTDTRLTEPLETLGEVLAAAGRAADAAAVTTRRTALASN